MTDPYVAIDGAYFAGHDSPDRAVMVEGPPLATKLSTKAQKPRAQQCAQFCAGK
jgi:hypothetical protein